MSTTNEGFQKVAWQPSAPSFELYQVDRLHQIGDTIRSFLSPEGRLKAEGREEILGQIHREDIVALKQQDPEAYLLLFPSELCLSKNVRPEGAIRVEDVSLPAPTEVARRVNVYTPEFTADLVARVHEATAFIREKVELISSGAEAMPDILSRLSVHLDRGAADEQEAVVELHVVLERLKELHASFARKKAEAEMIEPISLGEFHRLKTEVEACESARTEQELALCRMKRAAAEDEEQKKHSWWLTTFFKKIFCSEIVPTPQAIQGVEESLKASTHRIDDLERKLSGATEAVGAVFRQQADTLRFITLIRKIKTCIEPYLEILEHTHVEIQIPSPAPMPLHVSAESQDRYRLRPTIPALFFEEFEKDLAEMKPEPPAMERVGKRLAEIQKKNSGGFSTHDAAIGEINLLMGEMRDLFGDSSPLVRLCNKEIAVMMDDAIRLT